MPDDIMDFIIKTNVFLRSFLGHEEIFTKEKIEDIRQKLLKSSDKLLTKYEYQSYKDIRDADV